MRRMGPRFQPDVFDENMKLVNEVRKVAERRGCTVSAHVICWHVKQLITCIIDCPSRYRMGEGLESKARNARIIPFGASTVERVEENLKEVLLDDEEMALLEEAVVRRPIQGHRWPPFLEQFAIFEAILCGFIAMNKMCRAIQPRVKQFYLQQSIKEEVRRRRMFS